MGFQNIKDVKEDVITTRHVGADETHWGL